MADYLYITTTGVILPDTAELQDAVIAEYKEAFGVDLVVTPDTPQGVLITAETLARDAVVRNNAALANQINPDLAGGVFLDALWALTGGARVRATRSLVLGVVLAGVQGSIIPAGSVAAVGPLGAQFELAGTVQLDALGQGVGIFQAVEAGPVAAAAGALNTIISGVLGWETVTNPTAALPGQVEESDIQARRRRRNTLALQTVALPEAIVSGVFSVDGVRSVLFRENITAAAIVIEGVNLKPHSIYVAVQGGTDEDVAAELLRRKSLGAGWNGDTTVDVIEPISGQSYPVQFQRPDAVQIYVAVTVKQGSEIADPVTIVRAALLAYANGLMDGEDGFVIGHDVSPWELAGAISTVAPGLYVQSVTIGTNPGALGTANIPTTIRQIPILLNGSIGVTVNP